MHEFWSATFNKIFGTPHILAPIRRPVDILDIGCGAGTWVTEVADCLPSCQVYGVDISPVMPVFVSDNCNFYIENALAGFSFHDEKFDLVQSRCIGAGIPDRYWPRYVHEIYRVTKPGGWIQLIEMDPVRYCDDGSMPPQSPLTECERIIAAVMKQKYHTTIHGVTHKLARHAENAGFINIQQHNIKSPLGKWNKGRPMVSTRMADPLELKTGWRIAKCLAELLFSARHILLDGVPNATEAEVDKLLAAAQKELLSHRYRAYYKMWAFVTNCANDRTAVYAQRPIARSPSQ